MRFSAALIALVFGSAAMVSASPATVEYVTVTYGAPGQGDTSAVYSTDAPTNYQVSPDMPESDIYQMLCLVNKCRSSHGKAPLALHDALVKSAQLHSQYMASIGDMTHNDYRGDLGARVTSSGFPSWSKVSENIASGQSGIQQVMDAWINSPGHLANILGDTVYCGFGRVGNMWTQEFASPSSNNLYPQGSQPVCPNPGSQPVYSTAAVSDYNQDTYSTVGNAPVYETVPVADYTQEGQGYSPIVEYVTEYVADTQQPADVYYTTEQAVGSTTDGCE